VRLYETTFIINPQSDDATIDRQVKAVSELITTNGGKIVFEDRIGTRRLAYEIRGLTQGYYANFVFEGPASVLPVLDRHYRLEEPYIRFLTTIFEGDVEAIRERRDTYATVAGEPAGGASASKEERPARAERRETPAPAPAVEEAPAAVETPAPEAAEPVEEAGDANDEEL
jgi:small subunit ribosomal protein S6